MIGKDRTTPAHTGTIDTLPFDHKLLDRLLEKAGIDVLLVTSKHNIQYLLGGYRFFFFDYSDAIGVSRYLPILVYPAGQPEKAAYIGNAMEDSEIENGAFWCPTVDTTTWTATDAMSKAVKHLRSMGLPVRRIGVEYPFLPLDTAELLREQMPDSALVEAHLPLERLRARKTPQEIEYLREASERVVDSMIAVFGMVRHGMTKRELTRMLRHEEIERDLVFEYCLITVGTSHNRAPNEQRLRQGDPITLDSGGRYRGYIGDLCRMGCVGQPDAELVDLLGEVEEIQQAARRPIRQGAIGQEIFEAAHKILDRSANKANMHFVAHGMGIIGHEAPRLSERGPVTYPAYDAGLPLENDMVLSVETTLIHPSRGYIKVEDTLIVAEHGVVPVGDHGRGWNGPAS
jgi:Xaa-Pro aminopeptidase